MGQKGDYVYLIKATDFKLLETNYRKLLLDTPV